MKILYVTQTFPPEPGSTSRVFEQAICLQKLGCKVTVLTTMPSYPLGQIFEGYRGKLIMSEKIQGIDVIRVWSVPAPNKEIFLRLVSLISFAIVASIRGMFISQHDLVIARVPNIGTELACIIIARLKGSKLLLELEDVVPDNLALIGVSSKSFLARTLVAYYKLVYRIVDLIAILNKNWSAILKQRGVASNRILLLPNAADSEKLTSGNAAAVRQRFYLGKQFVVVYAGSFSAYYDVPNMVVAASLLQQRLPQVSLMLIGTGSEWKQVEYMLKTNSLDNIILVGSVTSKEIGAYMQAADLFICSLAAQTIPNIYYKHLSAKICEYLMVGRPVLAVESSPVCGNILERIGAGFAVPARRPKTLAQGIEFFATNHAETIRCGNKAKQYARTNLERKKVVEKFYVELVQKLNDL